MTTQAMIYLASRSPRRRELLTQIGVRFEPLLFREGARNDQDTDEAARPGEQADEYVRRVTRRTYSSGCSPGRTASSVSWSVRAPSR